MPRGGPFDRLTPRQRQIAEGVASGATVYVIAAALTLSPHTVRSHIRAIAVRLANPHNLPACSLIRRHAREAEQATEDRLRDAR